MNEKELLNAEERAFGTGISVTAGFDLGSKSPLDARASAKTLDERDAHVLNHRAYEGMIVYVEETKLTYQYFGDGVWEEFGFNQADFEKGIVDNLTTGGRDKALSAEQGKILKTDLNSANSSLNSHKADAKIHVTETDKGNWNAKETPSGAQAKATKAYEDAIAYAEPKIGTKGTAFNKNFGTASGTVAEGNHNHNGVYLGKTEAAVSANKLTTPVKINGVSFDGSADITLDASPVEHTHKPSDITQDANNRFVTDTDKTNWNAKETTIGAQAKATKALDDAKAYAEPKFSKNTAFNKNFGTTSGTVAEGNHNHDALYLGKTAKATDSDKVDGYHVNDEVDTIKDNALWTATKTKGEINTSLTAAKSYTDTAVASLVDGAPDALNTLKELADALNEHEDAYDSLLEVVGNKADKDYVDGAVANVHSHSNKAILDATQQAFTTTLKTKLDGIETGANKYVLPKASSSTLGGVKVGSGLGLSSEGVISVTMTGDDAYCIVKEEEFTATENQTLFLLRDGVYMGSCGAIQVYVNGSKVPMRDIVEYDTNDRISIPTGVSNGDKVLVRYTQLSRLVGDNHAANHLPGGIDEIPAATQTTSGLMSALDKKRLDTLASQSTNVSGSTVNGNIIVDSQEVVVYRHPDDANTRHVTDTEKSNWNAKETPTGAQTKATAALNEAKSYAEPKFTKNTGFNKNFGTVAGTVSEGNHNHNSAYLGINAKATDADKVDGYHVDDAKTGADATTNNALWTANKVKTELDKKSNTHSHPYAAESHTTAVGTSTALGHVKASSSIAINSAGIATVVENSHNHTMANVTGLESALGTKASKDYVDSLDKFQTTEVTVNGLGGIPAGTNLNNLSSNEIIKKLLFPYVPPVVTASSTPNGGVFEKGNNQTVTLLRAAITKKSDKITRVEAFDGTTSLGAKTGVTIENGGTHDFSVSRVVSSNKNFSIKVTDATNNVVTSTTRSFSFVYPYYVGVCSDSANIDATLVKSLTKRVEEKGNKSIGYTTNNQRMVFAYPESYGFLKQIIDPNSFDITGTFAKKIVSITGLDGTPVNYCVYTNAASSVSNFTIRFNY